MRRLNLLTAAVLPLTGLALSADAQLLLSDNFERTEGNTLVPDFGGFSSWGAPDNGAGGLLDPAGLGITYTTTNGAFFQQTVGTDTDMDGTPDVPGEGRARFGRIRLDYNLAADPTIISAGGVAITFDINPSDRGGQGFAGRDWGGIGLSDTQSLTSIGGPLGFALGNEDGRLGVLPRNSGSMIYKSFTSSGLFNANNSNGNPANGSITETIFDQTTLDDYLLRDPADEDPFESDVWYTFRVEITADSGTIFDAGNTHTVKVFSGLQGGALTQLNLETGTPALESSLVWGDNATQAAAGGGDDTPGVNDAWLFFVGNGDTHLFDNVLIEAFGAVTPLDGDYNDDGSVDQGDLDLVLLNWGDDAGQTGVPAGWINMQPTGLIGQTELDGVLLNWGSTAEATGSAVPEPASLALLGGLGLMLRRRRA